MINYKEHFKKSCVYKITIADKIYVGSTMDTYGRMKHHLNALKRATHGNRYMQNAYNKYQDYNFSIIEEYDERPTRKSLLLREKHFIDILRPDYNLTQDPYSPSEKDRERISKWMKNRYATGKLINPWSLNARYIDIYNLDRKLLHKNISVKDAVPIIGVANRSVINLAIRNNRARVKDVLICLTDADVENLMPSE